jgi:hypothetical protein
MGVKSFLWVLVFISFISIAFALAIAPSTLQIKKIPTNATNTMTPIADVRTVQQVQPIQPEKENEARQTTIIQKALVVTSVMPANMSVQTTNTTSSKKKLLIQRTQAQFTNVSIKTIDDLKKDVEEFSKEKIKEQLKNSIFNMTREAKSYLKNESLLSKELLKEFNKSNLELKEKINEEKKTNQNFFKVISNTFGKFFGLFGKKTESAVHMPLNLPTPGPRADGISVNLTQWFREIPPGEEIQIDPIGGALYLYWLDENGKICHGTPGSDAGEGPMILYPEGWSGLFSTEDSGGVVSDEQLKQKKIFKFFGGSYDSANNYNSNGAHILQYFGYFFRIRADGTIFRNDLPRISLPNDIELESDKITPGLFYPIATAGPIYGVCYTYDEEHLPIPTLPFGGDSSACQTKSEISAAELMLACKEGRLQGNFAEGYFRIT